ncbi:MAG: fumarylacetoacetate hydrolase family protein [Bacteroidales bacterium]|nr:fumarylacetoacetate hydrolase family protein [Bacteroidales bacterium]
MRLCRFGDGANPRVGFYDERGIIPLREAQTRYAAENDTPLMLPDSTDLLDFLPPTGLASAAAHTLADWVESHFTQLAPTLALAPTEARLLVPIPRPNKIFLLAGNYADHIREGGGNAAERAETFPYVFMKPASTTLTAPFQPIRIPRAAPDAVDWELELGVVIGKPAKHVTESEALHYVAGYTVINDISQRKFRPNSNRKKRDRDLFFDWLHGKWFDSFCPVGPCVVSSHTVPNPQTLKMTLSVNGKTWQDANTSQQIFPVAAVIAFISQMVTLEPGDLIATGTPAGVGNTTGTYLHAGDTVHASIEKIGVLVSPVEAE